MTAQLLPFPNLPEQPRIVFGRVYIMALVDRAAELTRIPQSEICGPAKDLECCYARYAVIRVARDAGRSWTQIGRALGRRDHSTIISGYRRAQEIERDDDDFALLVRLLRQEVPR